MSTDPFEKRMEQLKQSYHDIPITSSRRRVIRKLARKNKRIRHPFRVTAYMAAILLVAAIGSMLLVSSHWFRNEQALDVSHTNQKDSEMEKSIDGHANGKSSAQKDQAPDRHQTSEKHSDATTAADDIQTHTDENDDTTRKQTMTENQKENAEQVIKKIVGHLKTRAIKRVPTVVPIDKGKYLTARVSSSEWHYEIQFFQTNKPVEVVEVNDPALEKIHFQKRIASFEGTTYKNEKLARRQVQPYEKVEDGTIPLNDKINARAEGAAGHQYVAWTEGRWYMHVDSPTDPAYAAKDYASGLSGEKLAKKVVAHLDIDGNFLPPPHQIGAIDIRTWEDSPGISLKLQENDMFYQLETQLDPAQALDMAVSITNFD